MCDEHDSATGRSFSSSSLSDFEADHTEKGEVYEQQNSSIEIERVYVCASCSFSSPSLIDFEEHRKVHAEKEKVHQTLDSAAEIKKIFVCASCNFLSSRLSDFQEHRISHAEKDKISASCQTEGMPVMLVIPHIPKQSVACQTEYPLPVTTHSPLVVVARPLAHSSHSSMSFSSVECQTDEYSVTPVKEKKKERHECPYCSYTTNIRFNMKIHIKTHTGEKPYQCSHCDKRFSMKSNLTIHTRSHTGQRPYTCEACNKSFASRSVLQRHRIRLHTEERPFVCDICFMGFKFRPDLNCHKRTHRPIFT